MMIDCFPGVEIQSHGGSCPVQIEGLVDGQVFYFRARGSRWSVSIGGDVIAKPDWRYEQPYGHGPFDAGWMSLDEAREFLQIAIGKWRSEFGGRAGR